MAFTDKMLSMMGFHPRNGASDGYPFDLDASLRYVRPKTGLDIFPQPNNWNSFDKLGCVSGLLPQMDGRIWAQAYGARPFGPIASNLPENLQWQINIPGLNKQLPQY